MHCLATSGHRHVKLRFVRLAEGINRHAHNHLVDCLGLSSMARHNKALVNVQAFDSEKDLSLIQPDLSALACRYSVQRIVAQLLALAREVLGYPDPVTDRKRNRFGLEYAKAPWLRQREKLFLAVLLQNKLGSAQASDNSPLFAAFKSPGGPPVKFNDAARLIINRVLALGGRQIQSLKSRYSLLTSPDDSLCF